MNEEIYLPIGSVVKLKKSKGLVMIIGYFIQMDDKKYDYACCLFPDGILSLKDVLTFNNENIDEVYYLGYKNNKYKLLNEYLLKINDQK